jgi:acetyl esterase/lipase
VVAIHGGSWTGGSKAEYGPQIARLARHGYAVIVPDYRLARPGEPSWPKALEDLREVVRWVRRHAGSYQLDPTRVVALGSGAGGHLAALLGTDPPELEPGGVSAGVQAVVDLYGPTDLAALLASRELEDDPIRRFLGATSTENLAAASPVRHVTADDPPMLILHGQDDRWVPPDQSRALAESLASAGVQHRLIVLPGARQGFELKLGDPTNSDLLPEILAFLETVWQAGVRHEP